MESCEYFTSLVNQQNHPHTFKSDAHLKKLYHDLDDLHINKVIRAENELIINTKIQSMGTNSALINSNLRFFFSITKNLSVIDLFLSPTIIFENFYVEKN